jgi:hypothetical protein
MPRDVYDPVLLLLAQLGVLFLLSRSLQGQLSGLLLSITRSQRASVWLMALLFLPGTFIHELSHLVMARLLFVRAGHLTIIPRVDGDRVVMGSVLIVPTDRIRRLIIGIAPGIVGISIIVGALWFVSTHGLWGSLPWILGLGYLIFQVGNTLFSSRADLEGSFGLVLILGLLVIGLYWLGVRPSIREVTLVLDSHHYLLLQVVWLLWIPLILDAIGVIFVWLLSQVLRR